MISMIRVSAAIFAAVACLAGSSAAGAADIALRTTIPANALFFLPLFVATDAGYFRDAGITMETVITQGDGPDIDALIAGSVQFTISTPNRLFTAYQQGKPLLGVMEIMDRMGIQCFMSKAVAERVGLQPTTPLPDRLAKLKGLTIAGTRPGAFTYLLAIDYLKRAHLVPQQDAKVIGIGTAPGMIAAVENGQVDVGCFGSPVIETAVSRGKSVAFINNTQGEDSKFTDFLFEMVYVMPDYARQNPDTVRKVLAALVRANGWIISASNEDIAAAARKHFNGIDDAILTAAIASLRPAFPKDPRVTEGSFAAAQAFLHDTDMLKGDIPFAKVIDNSFLPH
jgi:ABC-type nitrate/sulfonate/bicarbonate transport system substrate-binding protein